MELLGAGASSQLSARHLGLWAADAVSMVAGALPTFLYTRVYCPECLYSVRPFRLLFTNGGGDPMPFWVPLRLIQPLFLYSDVLLLVRCQPIINGRYSLPGFLVSSNPPFRILRTDLHHNVVTYRHALFPEMLARLLLKANISPLHRLSMLNDYRSPTAIPPTTTTADAPPWEGSRHALKSFRVHTPSDRGPPLR